MGKLTGRHAIITGGSSGIGKATALLFAQEGAAVAVVDLDEANGQAVVKEIEAQGGRAIFIRCDVSKAEDCRNAVEKTV